MSKSSIKFDRSELTELLTQSRVDNLKLTITGLLLYADGNFMQLLEGSKEDVLELMERIKKDPRHHDIHVLEESAMPARHFSEWSMAFLDFASPHMRTLPGYSTFLEAPFADGDVAEMGMRGVRLLHYFKSVMSASDSTMLSLAESLDPQKPSRPANGHASEPTT